MSPTVTTRPWTPASDLATPLNNAEPTDYDVVGLFDGTDAEVARQADADAFPWGEPGEKPTEPGEYWVITEHGAVRPAELLDSHDIPGAGLRHTIWSWPLDVGYRRWSVDEHARSAGWRFRPRWTPAPPEGGE